MKRREVTMVRVYLTEGRIVERLVRWLHDDARVTGVTVFRGIAGFGASGEMHTSRAIDAAFDLPVVIEFYEAPPRAQQVIEGLGVQVEPHHIVTWHAQVID